MRLVLCGTLHLLETNGDDIRRILEKDHHESLIRSLDAMEMGVFWVSSQIDSMIALQDANKKKKWPECPAQHSDLAPLTSLRKNRGHIYIVSQHPQFAQDAFYVCPN